MATVKSIMEQLKAEFEAIFDNGHAHAEIGQWGEGDNGSHCITLYVGDGDVWSNNIPNNDPFDITLWIHRAPIDDKFILECDGGFSFLIKCSKDECWTGCKRVKTPYRKKNMIEKKLIPSMRTQFEKLKVSWDENKNNLAHDYEKKYVNL